MKNAVLKTGLIQWMKLRIIGNTASCRIAMVAAVGFRKPQIEYASEKVVLPVFEQIAERIVGGCSMTNVLALLGRYDVQVTGRGVVTLPRDWRSILVEDGVVYVMPNLHERCLLLLRKSALDDEIARLRTQTDDPDAKTTLKCITENAKLLRVDGRGRVGIPADQREFAGIGKMVSLVGNVRHVAVWATEALLDDRKDGVTWECIEAAMNECH